MQLLAPVPIARAASTDASTLPGGRGLAPFAGGAGGGAPSLDPFSGAASFELPLRAPLGTGGMTPSLALRYSSHARGESWVGFGWSLGFPAITRSLDAGTPAWDDAVDGFELAGQKLVPESADPSLPRRYRTERESFLRVEHHASGFWTATTPGGVVMRFGVDATQARITNPEGRVFQWLMDQQEDPNGNAFVVSYDRRDPGTAYPSVVRYTLRRAAGDGALQSLDGDAAKDRRIEFVLEPRSDVGESRRAGFPARIAHRLAFVVVRSGGALLRRYDLRYTQSGDTSRSLLAAVAEYGSDAAAPAPQAPFVTSFKYHSNAALGRLGWAKPPGWLFPPFPLVDATRRDHGVRLVDVDGDALPDLVKALATLGGGDPATATYVLTPDSGVYRNTGAGFESSPSTAWRFPDVPLQAGVMPFSIAWIQGGAAHTTGLDIVDASGDGIADLVGTLRHLDPNTGARTGIGMPSWFLGRAAGGFEPVPDLGDLLDDGAWGTSRSGLIDLSYLQPVSGTTSGNARFVELDGDGRPELVVRGLEDRLTAIGGPEPYQFGPPYCVDARRSHYYFENRGGLRFARAPVTDASVPECPAGVRRTAVDFQHCDVTSFLACGYKVFFNQTYPMRFAGDPYVGTLPWYWFVNRELGVLDVDLNDDGLADTLSASRAPAHVGYGSVSTAFINDGRRGYLEDTGWRLPTGVYLYDLDTHHSSDGGVRLADVDGDGRVDVVRAKGEEPPRIWLNRARATGSTAPGWSETPAWSLPEGIAFADADGRDTGARLADVDGDGMTDLVRSFGDENEVYLNLGSTPDLLTAAALPAGGTLEWSYAPSTLAAPSEDGAPAIPFVVPLVETVTRDASPGTSDSARHVTRYAYAGGSWDAVRRELRGFARVVETRPDGARVVRRYATGAALHGKLLGERIEDASGALWLAYDYEYVPQPDAPPWPALLARVRRHEQDAQAGPPRTTLVEYRYDATSVAHGAPAAIVEYGAVGAGDTDLVPGDSRTTEFEFVPNDATHLVDRVKARRLRRGATPGAGAVERETRFFYDGDATGVAAPVRGLLTRRVDVLGEPGRPDPTVTWTHDVYGNPIGVTDARANAGEGGGTTVTEYDAELHTFPSAVVDALGHRTEYDFTTAPGCSVAQGAGAGLAGTQRGPNEIVSGASWRRCYDVFGRIVSESAPEDLAHTSWSREDAGPETSVTVSRRASAGGVRSETTRLDGFGRVRSVERDGPHGRRVFESVREYDALGRLAAQRPPSFDAPHAQRTTYAYDPLGRVVETTLPGSGRTQRSAYAPGIATRTGPTGSLRREHSDAFGRITRVEEEMGVETFATAYEYDASDQLIRLVDHHGNTSTIEYDRVGRRTRVTDPDVGARDFAYFADGSVAEERVGAWETILWDYDRIGRVTGRSGLSQRWPSAWATWRYDTAANGIGRLARSTEDNVHTHHVRAYDALGQVTRETHVVAAGNRDVRLDFENAWDALGQPRSRRHPTGTVVTWQRDARGYLIAIDSGGPAPDAGALAWTADGRLAAWTSPGGVVTRTDFDAATQLLRGIEVDGPEPGALVDVGYVYDRADRVRTRIDYEGDGTEDYGYDALGRLRSTRRVEGGAWVQRTSEYDAIGNLLCRDATGPACAGGVAYTYPFAPADPLRRATSHQAVSIGGVPVAHHAGGALDQLGARRFLYDAFGRLAEVQDGGAATLRVRYDGAGRSQRIWTPETGENHWLPAEDFEWMQTSRRAHVHVAIDGLRIATHTLPLDPPSQPRCAGGAPLGAPGDPLDLLALFAPGLVACALWSTRRGWRRIPATARSRVAIATGTGTAFFVATIAPLPWGPRDRAEAQGGGAASLYYHRDHLGSVAAVTDATGAALAEPVAYRAWGETEAGATLPGAFGYHGMRSAAGLYDYGARWYDPAIARFVQPDPVIADPYDPQGLGRYAYVRNDPVGRIDPTGAFSFSFNAWAGQVDPYGFTGVSVGFDYGGGSWSLRGSASVRGVQVASARIVQLAQAIQEISRIGAFQFFDAMGVNAANAAGRPAWTTPNFLTGPGLRQPGGVASERDEKVLAGLHPFVANLGAAHLDLMEAFGIDAFLIEGMRSYDVQDHYFDRGRKAGGRVVTHARGGQSFHNFGLAYDIGVQDRRGRYVQDGSDPRYATAGFLGELVGLEWGGRWQGRRFDPSHFQYRGGRSLQEVRSLFEQGKDPLYGY